MSESAKPVMYYDGQIDDFRPITEEDVHLMTGRLNEQFRQIRFLKNVLAHYEKQTGIKAYAAVEGPTPTQASVE